MAQHPEVYLAFVETDSVVDTQAHYPDVNKVGGRPCWLDPLAIPSADSLACPQCTVPMPLLLQIYAPLEGVPAAHHRTLMIFCCNSSTCHSSGKCFKVLRAQLPQANAYYDAKGDPVQPFPSVELCAVCGHRASKRCGQCHQAWYCSRDHQRADWQAGHKLACTAANAPDRLAPAALHPSLFRELGLVTEPEPEHAPADDDEDEDDDDGVDKADQEVQARYQEYLRRQRAGNEPSAAELAGFEQCVAPQDPQFAAFQRRVRCEPEQVLRYCRGGSPLWTATDGQPADRDIPPCPACRGRRVFECQVMPQLLYYLKAPALDWGTLVVYACENSCGSAPYVEEFLWRQP